MILIQYAWKIVKPAYIFGSIFLCIIHRCMGLPEATLVSLRAQLRQGNNRDVIAWCIWVCRFKYRFGHLRTTINPVAYCNDLETADFIFNNLSGLQITVNDTNPVLTACSLWMSMGPATELGRTIPFLEQSRLRDGLKAFIIARTQQYNVIAAQVPMSILAKLEGRSPHDKAVIQDVKTSLQTVVLTEKAKEQVRLKAQLSNDNVLEIIDLMNALTVIYGDIFLCGNTLFQIITSGLLYGEDRIVELGRYGLAKTSTKFQLPKKWKRSDEDSCEYVNSYNHVNGMTVKLWHHLKDGSSIIRCDEYFCWRYSECNLNPIVINGYEALLPSNIYIEEEFGNINSADGLFAWTKFRAQNIAFHSESSQGFIFLAKSLSEAISESNRYLTRVIVEMVYRIYQIDFRHHLPKTDIAPIAICVNSKSANAISTTEMVQGTLIIDTAIERRLSWFLAKGIQQNVHNVELALKGIKGLLDKTKTPFFLIGGTLLGAIREGGIINSDYDVDIGVFQKDIDCPMLCQAITSSQSFCLKDIVDPHLVKVMHENGVELDIFLHDYHDGKVRHKGRVHEWFNDDFCLGAVELFGERFNVPKNAAKWLEENYGYWKNPILFYNVSYDTPNRKYVTETPDAIYHLSNQIQKSIKLRNYSNYILASKALRDNFELDMSNILTGEK